MKPKHRKQSFTQRRLNTALIAGAAAVIGVGGYTAIDAATTDQQPASEPAANQAGTINQTGRVLAVSDSSMTAQSIDGLVRTYQLTPRTAKITDEGTRTGFAPDEFAVNQVVTIVATVNKGTATATAVADQQVASGQGAPMDFPEGAAEPGSA